jgi:hypothetical protein
MKLADLERTDDGDFPRFVARVADASGAEEFELRLAGPSKVVEQMLADATFDLTIDSAQDDSWVRKEFDSAHEEHRRSMWELAAFDNVEELLKPSPRRPDRDTSVFASARPLSGEGTPFFFTASGFFVPTGVSFFLFGPFVLASFGSLRPASGDQDLILHLFSPTGPIVSASRLGGTALDVVMFGVPFFPFVPVFQVFGFTAGVCSTFTAVGA